MVAQSVMTGCYLGTGVLLGVDRARSGAQTAAADEIDRSGAGAPLPFAMTVEPARGCWRRLPIQTALRNLAPLKFGENHRPMCGMRDQTTPRTSISRASEATRCD